MNHFVIGVGVILLVYFIIKQLTCPNCSPDHIRKYGGY